MSVVLLDIEGTTTPIRFVHDVLFPFARAGLPALLAEAGGDPEVRAEVEAVRQAAPGRDPLATLLGWMDQDAKVTPLKALQGLIWRRGYAEGKLRATLYEDVAPALRRWREAGHMIFIYSSGSVEAQKLLFAHSSAGDLTPLLGGYFDTRTGPKRDEASYTAIAEAIGAPPSTFLFLSDVEAELDAAAAAGLRACQLVRETDGTKPSNRHPTAPDFLAVEAYFRLIEESRQTSG